MSTPEEVKKALSKGEPVAGKERNPSVPKKGRRKRFIRIRTGR